MVTIAASIEDRYNQDDLDQKAEDFVVIVSVSSSPQRKQGSVLHSHWSRNVEARLSLVESFPSDAGASSLMP